MYFRSLERLIIRQLSTLDFTDSYYEILRNTLSTRFYLTSMRKKKNVKATWPIPILIAKALCEVLSHEFDQ